MKFEAAEKFGLGEGKVNVAKGFSEVAWLIWLAGAGCDGCTMAMLGAAEPSLEDLLSGAIPDAPRLALLHPHFGPHFLSQFNNPTRSFSPLLPSPETVWPPGETYETMLRRAAGGELAPFVLVLEGGLYTEPLTDGSYTQFGTWRNGRPATTASWVRSLAPQAEAVLALGSCASFGGVPAAAGGVGAVQGLEEFLGHDFRSRGGLPVIHLPGCAPPGEALIETLIYTFLHLAQLVPLALDDAHRPRWLFNHEAYPLPPRADYAPPGKYEMNGKNSVQCIVPTQGWTRGLGGCTRVGGGCIACTERGFTELHVRSARLD